MSVHFPLIDIRQNLQNNWELIETTQIITVPWYTGNMSIESIESGGGGGVAVMPVSRERDIPNINIKDIEEKEDGFNISVLHFMETEK